jgi:hypothetical protein
MTVTLDPGVYSAFVLDDNGTWEQPSFLVPPGQTEADVMRVLLAERHASFYVCGLAPDPDAHLTDLRLLVWS